MLFIQGLFDPRGKDDLFDLALNVAVRREQEVLHHLLRDRRSPAHIAPTRAHRLNHRRRYSPWVIARMVVKILILRRDKRLFHKVRNFFCAGKKTPFAGEFIHQDALTGINPADRRRRIGGQLFLIGQIVGINPQNRSHADRRPDNAQRDKAENSAQSGQNEHDKSR